MDTIILPVRSNATSIASYCENLGLNLLYRFDRDLLVRDAQEVR